MLEPYAKSPRQLRPAASRRGFALIAVIGLLVVLTAYLFAAQGALMTSRLRIERSGERLTRMETAAALLAEAQNKLKRGIAHNRPVPDKIEVEGLEGVQTFVQLRPGADVYSGIPGVSYREGDALVTIVWTEAERSISEKFLINGARNRTGALHIATMEATF